MSRIQSTHLHPPEEGWAACRFIFLLLSSSYNVNWCWIKVWFIWHYEPDILTLYKPRIISTWCDGKASTLTRLTMATVLWVLSKELKAPLISLNNALNRAIKSSARSIRGPVMMRTLKLDQLLVKQDLAIYLRRKEDRPRPLLFFIQMCLWFWSECFV